MTHPDILMAEKTGYPDWRLKEIAADMYVCDCGGAQESATLCKNCGHDGCKHCMILDETVDEWFCHEECQVEYLHEENQKLADKLNSERLYTKLLKEKMLEARDHVNQAWGVRDNPESWLVFCDNIGHATGILGAYGEPDSIIDTINGHKEGANP